MNRWNKVRFVLVNLSFIPAALGIFLASPSPYIVLVILGYGMAVGSNFANLLAHVDRENGYG